jgi:hypothetical protein
VQQYEAAATQSQEILRDFNRDVLAEVDMFQRMRAHDLRAIMREFAATHLAFFQQTQQEWEKLAPVLEAMKV